MPLYTEYERHCDVTFDLNKPYGYQEHTMYTAIVKYVVNLM